jgi:hypothetical protein
MRLFQLITFGSPYLSYFNRRHAVEHDHARRMKALLDDRYGNAHLLEPVVSGDPSAFFSVADDEPSQQAWARAHGLPRKTAAEDIVLAQVESHRADVLYNITPLLYDSRFVRRLPGHVKHSVCWRAAPVGRADLSAYDRCVCNFQGLLDEWHKRGWKTAWFEPAHDPVASTYAAPSSRPIDVAFVGGYSRHHAQRNLLLQSIASLAPRYDLRFHFAVGRSTRMVQALGPLRALAPSFALHGSLQKIARPPIYGRAMYELFGSSRIVINAAIDMAQDFRGNMRCWEAMGCGALMLSDEGIYPPGMKAGRDFEVYRDPADATRKIERILNEYDRWRAMADQGLATMQATYSKAAQWRAFNELVAAI